MSWRDWRRGLQAMNLLSGWSVAYMKPTYRVTLGALAATIQSFRDSRADLRLPDLNDRFIRCLYATYLSYLPEGDFSYPLDIKRDNRGELAEFLKSPHCGQLFVSRTKPGVTRGNHFHHTKTEKFLVVEGDAVVRFRHIESGEVFAYRVSGEDFPSSRHSAGIHAFHRERGRQ